MTSNAARSAIIWAAAAIAFWQFTPYPVLPRPAETFLALGDLWQHQGLGAELLASLRTYTQAVFLATVISLAISYSAAFPFFRPLATATSYGRFLSMAGLDLIGALVFGGGRPLKLALLTFSIGVFFVNSMADRVRAIPLCEYEEALTLRMRPARIVYEVVIWGTIPDALEILRQTAAMGWMMLPVVEALARNEGGVGAFLLNQQKQFHLAALFAVQILILAVGLLQDAFLGWLRKALCPWLPVTHA